MIRSLLVANRGEIACRIFRTARRFRIRTIAVYSDADARARHVREADEACRIGPAPARESYLRIPALIEAARATGADAIHPGYGFLSENADFAAACEAAGILFLGPPAAAIAAMGSKRVAKERMRAAGVPVLPGYDGDDQDLDSLALHARRLGFPLIIKPSAGGGGKGMRIVHDEAELPEALAAARRLAESAFGDGALLLERYLPAPRHVEVQVFADRHGNIVHLWDRDCSIQRRHQKVIEEAPAPDLPSSVRSNMHAAAITVAREIGYVGAGTVEFLLDGQEFYFMEMNTRLQVEHTVTEMVTGLDLVEWQLRVAAGEPLPLAQEQIRPTGHAIEGRVCAEDPWHDFTPSSGTLRHVAWPAGESIRVDAGFETGDDVPSSYDSLLGKVIARGADRHEAIERLAAALTQTDIVGVRSNERWLARVLRHPDFVGGRQNIAFLKQHEALGERLRPAPEHVALAALALHCAGAAPNAVRHGPWDVSDGFKPNLPGRVLVRLHHADENLSVAIEYRDRRPAGVQVGDERFALSGLVIGSGANESPPVARQGLQLVSARLGSRALRARAFRDGAHLHLWTDDAHFDFAVEDARSAEFQAAAPEGSLTSVLPGVVVAISVQVGQQVSRGQPLVVIEAMKMEHTVAAPHAGTVRAVFFRPGDKVAEGSVLLELERQD